jgi:uncharacterized protein (TIGR03118 family)
LAAKARSSSILLDAMKKPAVCLFLALAPSLLPAATGYLVHNLVADDKSTATADFYDPRLVNPWGNVASATSPFWTCDYGTGLSTIYTANDTNTTPLGTPNPTTQPTVPGPGGSTGGVGKGGGLCTGIVANIAPATTPPTFPVTNGTTTAAASFIFVTEDGVLSAWAGGVDATKAFVEMDNSKTAVYKGLALVTTPAPRLYAANFKSGGIDFFDANFKPVALAGGAFTDSRIPAGYAPFNIWNIGGNLYVAWAKQDANKVFDVPGVGNGYVDVFDSNGVLKQAPFISGGTGSLLNSPWGMALAPASFGQFANDLLVGNFGDGLINAFDPATGKFIGTLQDQNGKNIVIPGLWALIYGNGGNGGNKETLYFTAGPGGQKHGLLGSIQANPVVSGVANAAQPAAGVAPNTIFTIKGVNLGATKRTWQNADFNGTDLPTSLDGVTVTINGEKAFLSYVSPVQLTAIAPDDLPTSGQAQVVVSNNGLTSSTVNVAMQSLAPSFFLFNSDKYVAATHANGTPVGPPTLFANSSTPAAPGETISLYTQGLGATSPAVPNGQLVTTANPLVVTPAVLVNNQLAKVVFAGSYTGYSQINVTLPSPLPDGDLPIVISTGGYSSAPGALITIKNP